MIDTAPFEKTLDVCKAHLQTIRTSQATPAILDDLCVQAYGSTMRIQELASVHVPEPQMLLIQPWDKSVLRAIETAIRESQLHLNPVVDGETIRIPFPPLTEERRRELRTSVDRIVEEARITIRLQREELMKELKAKEKNGDISEDERFRGEKEIQQHIDASNQRIKEMGEKKGKEIMTL